MVRAPTEENEKGLSINDTITASADHSVGTRGVKTSGAASGDGQDYEVEEYLNEVIKLRNDHENLSEQFLQFVLGTDNQYYLNGVRVCN